MKIEVNELADRINQYANRYAKQTENIPPWEREQLVIRKTIEVTLRHMATAMRQEEE